MSVGWCRSVEVREAGALGDALALGAGVGAAGAQGAGAHLAPGACQYPAPPCKHARYLLTYYNIILYYTIPYNR